jgi:peroxiredoxin
MRRLLIIVVLLILAAGALYMGFSGGSRPSYEPVKLVQLGDSAPDFQLEDTQGRKISLSDLRGKVVLVNFWATWCPPCREEMPSMEALNKAMDGDDFVLLAINVEENGRSSVPAFLARSPYTFPILYDDLGVVQKLYGVYKFPESFVIRKDGTVDDRVIGAINWMHPETVAYFKELAKG